MADADGNSATTYLSGSRRDGLGSHLYMLRLFRPDATAVGEVSKQLGFSLPVDAGRWLYGDYSAARIASGEWLVRSEKPVTEAEFKEIPVHYKEVGHALTLWRLSSEEGEQILAMGGTIDFTALLPGSVIRTSVAHVPVVVMRTTDGCFEILVDTSLADYFESWIEAAVPKEQL